MPKSILWIDDSTQQHDSAERMLKKIEGIEYLHASSSDEARDILERMPVAGVVTDILRRHSDRSISHDDGYGFFRTFIRPRWPNLPVIFHTKNLPSSFQIDTSSQ